MDHLKARFEAASRGRFVTVEERTNALFSNDFDVSLVVD
jgi:predicted transcriptional regulator